MGGSVRDFSETSGDLLMMIALALELAFGSLTEVRLRMWGGTYALFGSEVMVRALPFVVESAESFWVQWLVVGRCCGDVRFCRR